MAPIDLMRGHPSNRLLATKEIQAAANKVLTTKFSSDSHAEDRNPLCYGPDLGNLSLRQDIANWSARKYGLNGSGIPGPERINLTSGASNGLASALTLCTSPITGYTRRAFIVSPTYFLACAVFQDCGFANIMTSISMTSAGSSLDFDALLRHLEEDTHFPPQPPVPLSDGLKPIRSMKPKHLYRYVLYCVTTFANPTGTSLSEEARRRLVETARKYDILLISDDVYDFLGYDQSLAPPKRLVTIDKEMGCGEDEKGHTLSNCSFSKLLGPGLRCGWMECASGVLPRMIGEGGANHSGGAPSQFASILIQSLLTPLPNPPIDTVITRLTTIYRHRASLLRTAIAKYLPKETHIEGGEGGYFMWIRLPEGYDAQAIVKIAAPHVYVLSGELVECPEGQGDGDSGVGKGNKLGWGERCLRIAVTYQEDEDLEQGIRLLGDAVKEWEAGRK